MQVTASKVTTLTQSVEFSDLEVNQWYLDDNELLCIKLNDEDEDNCLALCEDDGEFVLTSELEDTDVTPVRKLDIAYEV
jgi:hypothetical protein